MDNRFTPDTSRLASVAPLSLETLQLLRASGSELFTQASLYGQLARVEWAEEKSRLLKMLLVALLGYACLLCAMLFTGTAVLVLIWDTAYRIPAAMALTAMSIIGAGIALGRFQDLSALGANTFAATREELAADLALVTHK